MVAHFIQGAREAAGAAAEPVGEAVGAYVAEIGETAVLGGRTGIAADAAIALGRQIGAGAAAADLVVGAAPPIALRV